MIDYRDICMKDLSLRDYQQEAKEKIFSQWNYVNNVLYQMPTGTGKTRLFTSIIRDINVWGLRNQHRAQILIIAHRSELIEQIDRNLDKYHVAHGVIAGTLKEKRDLTAIVQVASIQTITNRYNQQVANNLNVDFIIIDEAHHSTANSYTKLWSLYPNSKKLGVTATPWRMNNGGFRAIFDSFLASMSIKEFINQGWLASYKYYSIPINSTLQKTLDSITEFDVEGDYKISALERTMDNDYIRAQLFDSYKEIVNGKKGIIYSISRMHSEHICEKFRSEGVNIVNIDSDTPAKEREQLVNQFKDGLIDIIVNVDIFSEGFDCPDIEFIQLARPTKSLVKYIQQVGRGLRKNGDKECIILDNVGMYARFGLPDTDRDWNAYFEGEEKSVSNKALKMNSKEMLGDGREVDISEGNEKMVLIQSLLPFRMNSVMESVKAAEVIQSNMPIKDLNLFRAFFIESKSFCKGKYKIEETEKGYFIVNTRNYKRVFLCKGNNISTGSIVIKNNHEGNFTIVRLVNNVLQENSFIVGFLSQKGRIMRFVSLDNSVVIENIGI